MDMPGRNVGQDYNFSFNGKLDDKSNGWQTQDYGYRTYDYRLGRFYSEDPLITSYPFYTPYQFAGNTPIAAIDLEGMEPKEMITANGKLTRPMMALLKELFDYSEAGMEKTVWVKTDKVNPQNSSAMTIGPIVFYLKNVYPDNNHLDWFRLICHEHEHRNEIENTILGSVFWYIKYGIGWLEYRDYYKNRYEQNAYKNGSAWDGKDIANKVFSVYGEEINKILFDKSLNDDEKVNEMSIIGIKYKLSLAEIEYEKLEPKFPSYHDRGKEELYHFGTLISDYKKRIKALEMNRDFLKMYKNMNNGGKKTEPKKQQQTSMF